MYKILSFLLIFLVYNNVLLAMDNKPYHHLPDGTFRNPEGSPERNVSFNWSFKVFNEEKRKLKMDIPADHIVNKKEVLENLKKNKNNDYIAWIGHATFLIKLGNTTIITDPVFEKNMGPLIFGPKRFVDPAIDLDELPEVNLFLFFFKFSKTFFLSTTWSDGISILSFLFSSLKTLKLQLNETFLSGEPSGFLKVPSDR